MHRKLTDREVFERGFPKGSNAGPNVGFKIEGDSTLWLGRTTAREMSRLLEDMLNAKLANRDHSDQRVAILKRQFYSSRLPQRLQWMSSDWRTRAEGLPRPSGSYRSDDQHRDVVRPPSGQGIVDQRTAAFLGRTH